MSKERLYTEDEVARLQQSEVQLILKGLLRNLTEVRHQRSTSKTNPHSFREAAAQERVQGEIDGLNIAIAAVRRRMR